jgi:hypothetical protein
MTSPTVFLSYSWDSENHRIWVKYLADYLIQNGINIILDQYELAVGGNMIHFMESSLEKADKVIILLTPTYKAKAELRNSGSGYEYSLISQELFEIQANNKKFLPILRLGDKSSSAPGFLKSLIYHDMSNDDRFNSDAFELTRLIFEEPEFKKPALGKRPDFSNLSKDPILEIAKSLDSQMKNENRMRNYIESSKAFDEAEVEIRQLLDGIVTKADQYKNKSNLYFNTQLKGNELILNTHGAAISLFRNIKYNNSLNGTFLRIEIFNRIISLEPNAAYYPGKEPKIIETIQLKPNTNEHLEVLWSNEKYSYRTLELREFLFSKVLDQAKSTIEIERKMKEN